MDDKGRHERMRTHAQLDAIRAQRRHGRGDAQGRCAGHRFEGREAQRCRTRPLFGHPIADNCRHSSKSWGQALPVRRGRDGRTGGDGQRLERRGGPPGSTLRQRRVRWVGSAQRARAARSRSSRTTGWDILQRCLDSAASSQQVTGFKTFDYNVDGLAHIGLVPDMVADLSRIGMDAHYVNSLFCSAEAYIRVWERAEALGARRPAPDPNRPWLCNVTDSTPPAEQRRADAADAGERLAS